MKDYILNIFWYEYFLHITKTFTFIENNKIKGKWFGLLFIINRNNKGVVNHSFNVYCWDSPKIWKDWCINEVNSCTNSTEGFVWLLLINDPIMWKTLCVRAYFTHVSKLVRRGVKQPAGVITPCCSTEAGSRSSLQLKNEVTWTAESDDSLLPVCVYLCVFTCGALRPLGHWSKLMNLE